MVGDGDDDDDGRRRAAPWLCRQPKPLRAQPGSRPFLGRCAADDCCAWHSVQLPSRSLQSASTTPLLLHPRPLSPPSVIPAVALHPSRHASRNPQPFALVRWQSVPLPSSRRPVAWRSMTLLTEMSSHQAKSRRRAKSSPPSSTRGKPLARTKSSLRRFSPMLKYVSSLLHAPAYFGAQPARVSLHFRRSRRDNHTMS